jgi:hypothetical protein
MTLLSSMVRAGFSPNQCHRIENLNFFFWLAACTYLLLQDEPCMGH